MAKKTMKNLSTGSKTPKQVAAPRVSTKRVTNVSLQTWPIPLSGKDNVKLKPGQSVDVPAHQISNPRLSNLFKRRLITIS